MMISDKNKVQIAMARACMTVKDIAETTGMPFQSVKNVVSGKRSVKPATIGRVAKALQVDVAEILANDKEET